MTSSAVKAPPPPPEISPIQAVGVNAMLVIRVGRERGCDASSTSTYVGICIHVYTMRGKAFEQLLVFLKLILNGWK